MAASKRTTQKRFHVWAAAARTCLAKIEALGQAESEKARALEELSRASHPDRTAVLALRKEIEACRREIDALVAGFPALDARASRTRSWTVVWRFVLDASLPIWAESGA
jgi:hypothetical protein